MPQPASCKGYEALSRMNYLNQISSYMATKNTELAAQYSALMKSIAERTLTHWDSQVKRNFCKGCNAVLIPGDTVRLRLHKKRKRHLLCTCLRCGTVRRFGTKLGYCIWTEKKEANA